MKKFISLSILATTIVIVGCQKTNNEGPAAVPNPGSNQVNGQNVDGTYGSDWDCIVSTGDVSRRGHTNTNAAQVLVSNGPEGFSTLLSNDENYDLTFSQRVVNGVSRAILSVVDNRSPRSRKEVVAQTYVEAEARTINLLMNTGYRNKMSASCVRK